MNPAENATKETLNNWQKNPNNWKWGVFYYNPEDKRAIVSKRIEWMGYTINFAHKGAVITFFIMLAFFVFVATIISSKK
jgi:uncharacterized membrane protein